MYEYVNTDSCMYACFFMWVFVHVFCCKKPWTYILLYMHSLNDCWEKAKEILSMEHSTNVDVSLMHESILGVNVCANVLIFEPLRNFQRTAFAIRNVTLATRLHLILAYIQLSNGPFMDDSVDPSKMKAWLCCFSFELCRISMWNYYLKMWKLNAKAIHGGSCSSNNSKKSNYSL